MKPESKPQDKSNKVKVPKEVLDKKLLEKEKQVVDKKTIKK
jgi:hypothetical protein